MCSFVHSRVLWYASMCSIRFHMFHSVSMFQQKIEAKIKIFRKLEALVFFVPFHCSNKILLQKYLKIYNISCSPFRSNIPEKI